MHGTVQIDTETGPDFRLSTSNYLELQFGRRVHWPAMLGAYRLIIEKPHTLWRLISSMLANECSPGAMPCSIG